MLEELEFVATNRDFAAHGQHDEVRADSGSAASPAGDTKLPLASIVIPTRNEAGNIAELVRRIQQALPGQPVEIIFVDDSDDETPDVIRKVGEEASLSLVLIHRSSGSRQDGLGGAVLTGLRAVQSPWACVMDADLQHPPELLPRLLEQGQRTNADLVVASRYSDSGSVGAFGPVREAASHLSTTAARVLFPRRLKGISDPMSGFFMVRKDAVNLEQLQPRGFKILLEILVRTPDLRVTEVGFQFGERHAGTSKATLREGGRYLSHLWQLKFGNDWQRVMRFVLVGASGLLVNTLLLALATDVMGLNYLLSAVLATQGSSLWNFGLTEFWVFDDRQRREGRLGRLLAFLLMNNAALSIRAPMLYLLTSVLGVHYLVSNLISLLVLTLVRYALADRLIWKASTAHSA